MNIKSKTGLLILCALSLVQIKALAGSVHEQEVWINAQNPLPDTRPRAETLIPLFLLESLEGVVPGVPVLTRIHGQAVANQWIDTDNDHQLDSLLVIADYAANERVAIQIALPRYGQLDLQYPPVTQAEMAMRLGGVADAKGVYSGGSYSTTTEV